MISWGSAVSDIWTQSACASNISEEKGTAYKEVQAPLRSDVSVGESLQLYPYRYAPTSNSISDFMRRYILPNCNDLPRGLVSHHRGLDKRATANSTRKIAMHVRSANSVADHLDEDAIWLKNRQRDGFDANRALLYEKTRGIGWELEGRYMSRLSLREMVESGHDIWNKKAEAEAEESLWKPLRRYDPRVFDLYMRYGLRSVPTSLYPNTESEFPPTAVTLTTTKHQEAWNLTIPNFEPESADTDRYLLPDWEPRHRTPRLVFQARGLCRMA
ncbi:hypothetical protein AOCH_000133 [Aspergillus ochraceoroseus]|uniref:Uncharacterized protein n=1 Tax=Aspergillus ochraceoroseus TaxID=138278 RepID=A0A0F8WV16_9EURO|nr:hypothetical protein AOCH_000133 [Aspergillus ochraceoroseus]